MTNLRFLSLIVFSFLVSSSNAQIVRYRSPTWRIIAGCVVGGVFAIFFALLIYRMMSARRGRRMHSGAVNTNQFAGKPMFGGPWGRSNMTPAAPMATYGPNQGTGYGNPTPMSPNASQYATPPQNPQYNPEYPPQNAPPPPPAYGQDANYGGKYSAPAGPPPPVPQSNSGTGHYAPPLGPPPAAHTTGEDGNFVGGFHSPRP